MLTPDTQPHTYPSSSLLILILLPSPSHCNLTVTFAPAIAPSYILMLGTLAPGGELEPKYAIIVKVRVRVCLMPVSDAPR